MVKKIYFDMDGVLADFDSGVTKLCGVDHIIQCDHRSKEDDDLMWEKIRDVGHFYDKLDPIPGAVELFRDLYEKYENICEILTGIPKPKRGIMTAGEDKIAWAHRILIPDLKVNIVYREEKKSFCAGKEYILIDDLESNIRNWECFGGTGILYKNADETRKILTEINVL